MKKIDLDFNLKNLLGEEIKDGHAGKIVAETLASAADGDALKNWGWANKFYKREPVDLDRSDFDKLKNFIESHKGLPAITKAQILIALSEAEDLDKLKEDKAA